MSAFPEGFGKKTIENIQEIGKGDSVKTSSFDVPGEQSKSDVKDIHKGDAGKPGSSFDGPWDDDKNLYRQEGFNPESVADGIELKDIKGGAYRDIPYLEGYEKHHMPADSATEIPYHDGPCVQMDTKDHRKTASWGSSKEAQEYREEQRTLISQGKFEEAFNMDVDDIRSKFNSKYDDGINQAKQYIEQFKSQGVI